MSGTLAPRCTVGVMLLAVWASMLMSYVSEAQTAPPLPPAAEEALNKGLTAARIPDYPLAIRYFEQARKAAPGSPIVFFNLGLAESKIPTRELRAMSWFGAYLAADPNAPNAALVKSELSALEVRSESLVSKVLRQAQEVANRVPDARPTGYGSHPEFVVDCWRTIKFTARLLALGGNARAAADLERAYRACDVPNTKFPPTMIAEFWQSVARSQAESGDFVGARDTAAKIPRSVPGKAAETLEYVALLEAPSWPPAPSDLDRRRLAGVPAYRAWLVHLDARDTVDDSADSVTRELFFGGCRDLGFVWNLCPALGDAASLDLTAQLDRVTKKRDVLEMLDMVNGVASDLIHKHRFVTAKLGRQFSQPRGSAR